MNEMISVISQVLLDSGIQLAYLFGSGARGMLRADSDIDIAIVGEISFSDRLDPISVLEERLDRDIDLVLFNDVPISFQTEILYNGVNIINEDNLFKVELEMKTFSNYLTFEEDRAPVIEAIYKRGSVY